MQICNAAASEMGWKSGEINGHWRVREDVLLAAGLEGHVMGVWVGAEGEVGGWVLGVGCCAGFGVWRGELRIDELHSVLYERYSS